MFDFKKLENKIRSDEFLKNIHDEEFLEEMNNILSDQDKKYYTNDYKEYPIIFLVGLPRSGTTLATQIIAAGLDVGYINNLIARFWKAPLHGIKLSNIVLDENKEIEFNSNYGKTNAINNLHEFSYFWIRWLKMENMPPYYPENAENEIDWNGLRHILYNIVNAFNKGIVLKGVNPAYHLYKISKLIKNSYFVFIDRDLYDIAISLFKARVKYYNNPNTWWSSYPREYNNLKNLSFDKQIAGQVYYLRKQFLSEFDKIESNRKYFIKYKNLCKKPKKFVIDISKLINNHIGYSIDVNIENIPSKFKLRKHNKREKENNSIIIEIDKLIKAT